MPDAITGKPEIDVLGDDAVEFVHLPDGDELEHADGDAGHATDESAASADGTGSGEDDDVVVLGWWQHPLNVVTMLVAMALIAGMAGWLVHDTVSAPDKNGVDVGFLQDMRLHHEQASEMSLIFLSLPDTEPGLRTVATSVLVGQQLEIGRMIQMLRDFDEEEARDLDTETMTWMGMAGSPGQMPGMATDQQIDQLRRSSGRQADELFVELMTKHHLGGISMAEYAAEHAANDGVRTMARSMVSGQRGDIIDMERYVDS